MTWGDWFGVGYIVVGTLCMAVCACQAGFWLYNHVRIYIVW